MRKSTWTGLCAAIVGLATAGVMAQAQAPAPQSSPSSADSKKITVTGCLKEAPAAASNAPAAEDGRAPGAVGTSGNVAAAKFILMNASASSANSAATYHLIANPGALTPHVGKKLELTGTIEEGAASAPQSANEPTLRVESGKVVGESCSQ